MTTPATLSQLLQVAVEDTPGTRPDGGADRRLQSVNIVPGIEGEVNVFEPHGYKFATLAAQGREWSSFSIEGQPDYNELVYLYASLLGTPTPTQQGGTAAYLHTFAPNVNTVDTVSSLYIEKGDPSGRAVGLTYGLVNGLGWEITRQGWNLQNGAGIGQLITDDVEMGTNEVQTITMTGTPTGGTFTITYDGQTTGDIDYNGTASDVETALEALSNIDAVSCSGGPFPGTAVVVEFEGALARTDVAAMTTTDSLTGGTDPGTTVAETVAGGTASSVTLKPMLPDQVKVYADATAAGLGTTQLTGVLRAAWGLTDRYGAVWTVDSSQNSWSDKVETRPSANFNLVLKNDAEGMAWLPYMRAGTKMFVRVEAIGETIEDAYTYKYTHDMCVVVNEPTGWSDNDGVWAVEWGCQLAYDSTWGKALEVKIINEITAL